MPQKQKPVQTSFKGGVNPMAPSHLIADDEVQTATNVDFSLVEGAMTPRRGCYHQATLGTTPILGLYRNYNDSAAIVSGYLYGVGSEGIVYRGNQIPTTLTSIATLGTLDNAPFSAYKQYALFGQNSAFYKDDGTNVTEWIKQVPSAPTVTVNTLTPITLSGTYTVPDGTLVGTGTGTNSSTCTFSTDNNNSANAVYTFTTATDLSKNGTNTVGGYGVVFIDVSFDDPTQVTNIGLDFSIGDATFANFWHVELDPQQGGVVVTSGQAESLINSQFSVGTGTATSITSQQRQDVWSQIAQYNFQPMSFVPQLAASPTPWASTAYQFGLVGVNVVGTAGANLWSNIYAMRVSVVTLGPCTVTIGNPQVYGATNFPLTDVAAGYYYWQTFATLDANNNKIDEGCPSPPAGPFLMQNANATVKQVGTATGTLHGVNAVITYRQGGYMQDAYAVHTATYGTALSTFTDTSNDIDVLSLNEVMPRNLLQPSQFAGALNAISETFQDRIFVGRSNGLRWTLPGQIGSFPLTNFQEVGRDGDPIQALLVWNPGLIIVNRGSIFELTGTDFDNGIYNLARTGARRGAVAPRSVVRTPFGIPLLNVDGLTMYQPGANVEQEVTWFMEKYGDIFKGGDNTDPASYKGSRIPALNSGSVNLCCAAYAGHKLYLGMPTGTTSSGQYPNTLFVVDFALKQCYWFTYPFSFTALYADERLHFLWATTSDGNLMILEYGTQDYTSAGSASPITWSARTKQWTDDSDTVLENLSIDSVGANIAVKGYYDNTNNPVVSTLTNTVRSWSTPPLNGTFVNGVAFDFQGTSTNTSTVGTLNAVYGMTFDLLTEPTRVRYYRTEYDEKNYQADKLWDVVYYDIDIQGTNTVTAVTFVDVAAVMTNTTLLVGPTNGRKVFEQAFPAETYGRVAYTTYTTTNTACSFKHWETRYDARNEPAKVTYWRTDITSLEENICDAWDVDLNPNGTTTGTVYIDNVATDTFTYTGSNRQSYTSTIDRETYGRTIYVAYTNTAPFKHYKTWFHLRREPDRWTSFVSDKQSGDEHEWKVFKPELNCLGNTVLGTVFIEGTAVSTHTITGTSRLQYTFSLPVEKFGRTIWCSYAATSNTFKHYSTEFEGDKEPPRVTLYRTGPYPFESNHFFKTWSPLLDARNGTVTGILTADDIAINTATFTGNRRQWYTVGMDLTTTYDLTTASRWEATYNSTTQFKHYQTKLESDMDPFRKVGWSFHYKKLGGASQLDMGRFWSMYVDVADTAVGTYWWDLDGSNFSTGTLTFTAGYQWVDRIPLPPGARARLFEFRLLVPDTIKVENVNIDLDQEGVKGLTRRGQQGTPAEMSG